MVPSAALTTRDTFKGHGWRYASYLVSRARPSPRRRLSIGDYKRRAYNIQSISACAETVWHARLRVTMTFMAVLAVILALTSVGLVRDGGDGSIIVLNWVCFH